MGTGRIIEETFWFWIAVLIALAGHTRDPSCVWAAWQFLKVNGSGWMPVYDGFDCVCLRNLFIFPIAPHKHRPLFSALPEIRTKQSTAKHLGLSVDMQKWLARVRRQEILWILWSRPTDCPRERFPTEEWRNGSEKTDIEELVV